MIPGVRCEFFICERCENSIFSMILEKVPLVEAFQQDCGEQRSGTVRVENVTTGEFALFGVWGYPLTIIVKNGNQNADVTV